MNEKEKALYQLEAIRSLDFCLYILIRFLHILWDDPDIEKDIREEIMAIYGDLTIMYYNFHKITIALEEEWETLYFDGTE